MVRNIISLALVVIVVLTLLISKQYVNAQTNCQDVNTKLINCEPFMLGYLSKPAPQCCGSAHDLVLAAYASRDTLRATCWCLKTAFQSFKVDFSYAEQITKSCNLKANVPLYPSVNCDTL
ncbi:unnamed protein product [Lactuca saligna]|uniref:Bifunctional inhibitor/plant lipid transfer protein/seed storage helical domain-containing protein n=1 Tax=Lactuca saligna TaxID=75948 RepID=A0AA36EEG5_LACSI|nr:unnamed protein product [Lactuca saligna]